MNKIGITTGDKLGIGEEVLEKALNSLNLPKENVIIIGKNLNLGYETIEINDKDNGDFCFKSIEMACQLAKSGEIQAIVTAPVSKEVLNNSGYKFLGQTEILEHFLGQNNEKAEMLFISGDLKVMLLTRHLALKDVPSALSEEIVIEKTKRFYDFLVNYYNIKSPKIALCGLNPHIGEGGLLGDEEETILKPAVCKLQNMGINVSSPISADALFGKIGEKFINKEKQEYDGVLACYHDQGLCPVKALTFDKVVNTTIGLPIIRTSPSHGSAYDIKGLGIANPNSMIEAIKLAINLEKNNA